MAGDRSFPQMFSALTGFAPMPWQEALYDEWFADGKFPESCNIPTGLGKTAVIAIWLIALAEYSSRVPRRLVYVVNRRTVVDQTTAEVEKLRRRLTDPDKFPEHAEVLITLKEVLSNLTDNSYESPLAISTLRGQFADNREWSADPSRPAVISGTVDMIGSRLLFSGYGVGFKAKPLQAGFLGQDVLLVHDEAHLEPAFQELLVAIQAEQKRCNEFAKFRVMELSATSRGNEKPFELTAEEKNPPITIPYPPTEPIHYVWHRLKAKKEIILHKNTDKKKLGEEIGNLAVRLHKDSCQAVLVFVQKVDDVKKVTDRLPKGSFEQLTGTLRGLERDSFVNKPIFQRFLAPSNRERDVTPVDGTVYLVCTSAGEVGVNISADHLVCDLSTFDSMAQRFGRVNRFSDPPEHVAQISIVYPEGFDEKNDYDQCRRKTLDLLRELNGDASPAALDKLDAGSRIAAFAPKPIILPTSDILFDAWALTTIQGKLPGRPEVEPYLHGLPTEWQPPETHVAWRQEVAEITGDMLTEHAPAELFSEYPLKPHELLRDRFDNVHKELSKIAIRWQGKVWLLDDHGSVEVVDLAELADKGGKDRLTWKTVILPPAAGGLSTSGMLDGGALPLLEGSLDVADELYLKNEKDEQVRQRKRIWNDDREAETNSMHEVVTIQFPGPEDDEDAEGKSWHWLRLFNEGDRSTKLPVLCEVHVGDVEREIATIVDALLLSDALKRVLKLAAKYHDHGKRRGRFQLVLGNTDPNICLAKSGRRGGLLPEKFRHEFGSLLDIEQELESLKLGEYQDLVLHLIAAHHGRARPHFPAEEALDPERSQADADRIASEVPRRFARLQRKYGRWGLAYLESLLRAADWAASASPSAYCEESK